MMKSKEEKNNSNFFSDTIEIDHRVYSRNMLDRWHWAKKQRLRDEYRILVRNQMRLNDIRQIEQKCELRINCYVKRLMDYDNVVGGLKGFIDSLTLENFIHDDSPKWLDIQEIKQIKAAEFKIIVERIIYL
tara:strand:+ start:1817 stop:2209 length:393 start_codon:yes stop_codon:yes gene_type:complete